MAKTRGAANEALYRARILLDSWDRARDLTPAPDDQLTATFMPAAKLHLGRAYGWFILSVSGVEDAPDSQRPSTVADLAPPEPGRSSPPELREFASLEETGWIGDMLREGSENTHQKGASGAAAGASMMLGSDTAPPGFAVAAAWHQRLGEIMARMDDSLAEC